VFIPGEALLWFLFFRRIGCDLVIFKPMVCGQFLELSVQVLVDDRIVLGLSFEVLGTVFGSIWTKLFTFEFWVFAW
jgi:hypothetical protein